MTTPGFQLDYVDPLTGYEMPAAWIVPMEFLIRTNNDNLVQQIASIIISFRVFGTQELYLAGKEGLNRAIFTNAADSVFLQYFGAALPTIRADMAAYLAAVANNPPIS